uniref:(northern house mosquito) hypothetical protein n=1 Tax=Culex pipiens TaxID=7175 RepID=A0A8D8GF22_CULPI
MLLCFAFIFAINKYFVGRAAASTASACRAGRSADRFNKSVTDSSSAAAEIGEFCYGADSGTLESRHQIVVTSKHGIICTMIVIFLTSQNFVHLSAEMMFVLFRIISS